MPTRITCQCGRVVIVRDDYPGDMVACPNCDAALQLRKSSPADDNPAKTNVGAAGKRKRRPPSLRAKAIEEPNPPRPTRAAESNNIPDNATVADQPLASLSGTSKPAAAKPGTSKPAASKPGTSKPGTSKPGTSKPSASKPGTSKPGTSKPTATTPAASQSATAKPGASKPAGTTKSKRPGSRNPATVPAVKSSPPTVPVVAPAKPASTTPAQPTPAQSSPAKPPPGTLPAAVPNRPGQAAGSATRPAASADDTPASGWFATGVEGYQVDRSKRASSYWISLGMFALTVFSLIPAVIQLSAVLQSKDGSETPRWVFLLMLMGLVQLAYAVYLSQLPDWSSAWVITIAAAFVGTFYAMMMAVCLMGSDNNAFLSALQLSRLTFSKEQQAGWCLIMLLANVLLGYVTGRFASRWRTALQRTGF